MTVRLMITVLLTAFLAHAQLAWKSTVLEFQPELGTEKVEGSYQFTNTGDAPITILRIKPSCGCTTVDLAKTVYQPGEQGSIAASMTIDKRGGTRSKTIMVESQAGDQDPQRQVLIIRSEMERLMDAKPRFIFWRNGEAPEPKSVEVTMQPEKKLEIRDVEIVSDAFRVEIKTIKPHEHYQVTLTPANTTTPIYTPFVIHASSPEMGEVEFKCYAKVLRPPTTP